MDMGGISALYQLDAMLIRRDSGWHRLYITDMFEVQNEISR